MKLDIKTTDLAKQPENTYAPQSIQNICLQVSLIPSPTNTHRFLLVVAVLVLPSRGEWFSSFMVLRN